MNTEDLKNRSYVYRHVRLDTNEVFYIGVGTAPKKCRKKDLNYYERSRRTRSRSDWWKRVVHKCGYEIEIVADDLSHENALELEVFLIQEYGRKIEGEGELVNLTKGGEGCLGYKPTKETREKLSASAKGRKMPERTKEWRSYMSKLFKEKYENGFNPCLGREYSEETLGNMSKVKKGNKNPMFGRSHKESSKNKISASRMGTSNPMYGITKGKSPSAKKLVDIKTGIVYDCVKCASEELGIPISTLSAYLNGRLKNKSDLRYYAGQEEKYT